MTAYHVIIMLRENLRYAKVLSLMVSDDTAICVRLTLVFGNSTLQLCEVLDYSTLSFLIERYQLRSL